MKNRLCAILVAAVWAVLAVWAWLAPSRDISVAERRQLAQKPAIQGKALLDGSFMTDFEDASLDQFPLRDTFREAKSLFHRFVLRQSDKSGIYISQGYAAAQEYPLSEASVNHAPIPEFTLPSSRTRAIIWRSPPDSCLWTMTGSFPWWRTECPGRLPSA